MQRVRGTLRLEWGARAAQGGVTSMKTMKLRTLQQPSRVEALLESLVKSQNWVPADAPRVTDRSELSSVLQELVAKTVKAGGAWRTARPK